MSYFNRISLAESAEELLFQCPRSDMSYFNLLRGVLDAQATLPFSVLVRT